MLGINKSFVEEMIRAAVSVYFNYMSAEAREVLKKSKAYGKGDTLGLDAIPEIEYLKKFQSFDDRSVFVTEETDEKTRKNLPDTNDPKLQPLVFVSDPMDRSSQMKQMLLILLKLYFSDNKIDTNGVSDDNLMLVDSDVTVQELWDKYNVMTIWEEKLGRPANIAGATSAITCIYRGHTIASVIINFISKKMFLACESGVFQIDMDVLLNDKEMLLGDICKKGQKINFPGLSDRTDMSRDEKVKSNRRFVTFAGKSGYPEHFHSSKILMGNNILQHLYYDLPGGPSRVLYLSDFQAPYDPIGFILSNGEKITEWIHWLPFVKYAIGNDGTKQLKCYEAFTEKISQKNGIPMSVSPSLSIFKNCPHHGRFININKIRDFDNPSHFRSMIVVCHKENNWLDSIMKMNGFRSIDDYF